MLITRSRHLKRNRIVPGLLLGLVLLLFSCTRRDDGLTNMPSKQSLSDRADQGDLLLDISRNNGEYIFNFEQGSLQVPVQDITKIVPEPERWRTGITFSDGSGLVIPAKGTSLDYIVEDITLNPSGYNPLAALVNVWLPTYGRVKVTVHGKNGEAGTITHLCHEDKPRQSVPVFGLYAGYDNTVDLTFTDREGRERGSTTIHIRTTPLTVQDFPKWKLVKSQPGKMEPGINLVNYPGMSEADVSLPYMIDNEGELRWLLLLKSSPNLQKLSTSIGLKRTKKGTFIAGDQLQPRIVELDMFGNLLHQWDLQKPGYTFHHEIKEAANGNFLITVTSPAARLTNGQPRINDHIIELNPESGALVSEWDLANLLDTARYVKPDGITPPQYSQNPTNWAHNNSINEIGNDLLATARYQGIFRFTHAGKLRWIISPHKYWGAAYQPYLLNPVDENGLPVTDPAVINGDAHTAGFDWPWGPHTPVVIADDHILVFDNGYNRNWIPNFSPGVTNYSRVVEYRIDENKKTVQQVWSFGKERGAEGFSQAISGVQLLPQTRHVLFCPGMGVPTSIGSGGRIIEIDPTTNEVLFEMEIATPSGTAFHRVNRMPLYPETL
ncbi:arylsulfate sulfotransferase [Niabella drilacis]|uniref:Arylsulfate sulfotransferase n=2 Tax=Niabella drilacis (strain DSM 25811 / CCM 8410 / CCUG 62505 / LMG 26954 / E90) TaxID=1285928 RepID=A0A1G6U123_NIADE|nr:arylsulfate sulfotransferase [Niabella drilacis]